MHQKTHRQSTLTTILFLTFLLQVINTTFCSSNCIDYFGVCTDETSSGCTLCSTSLYNILPTSSLCSLLPQTSILSHQLSNSAMDTSTFITTSSSPLTCNNYTFSGEYTANDFISKNYTNMPLNHYQLVIRFNLAFLGTWNSTDTLRMHLQDDEQSVDYDYPFSCTHTQNICDQLYNTTDCIRIKQEVIHHNASFLLLNFSALTNETDPNIQSWAIKELIIAARECHPACSTCFGNTDSQCLSCQTGFYLQGNVCLNSCNSGFFSVLDQRLCVQNCPSAYFPDTLTSTCTNCAPGCLVCSNSQLCQAWSHQSADNQSLWEQKMEFWILLILVLVAVAIFIVFKIAQKVFQNNDDISHQEQQSVSHNEKSQVVVTTSKRQADIQIEQPKVDREQPIFSNISAIQITNENMVQSIVAENNLWFNELVDPSPLNYQPKSKARRKRFKNSKQPQIGQQVTVEVSLDQMQLENPDDSTAKL